MYLQKGIYNEFLDKLASRAEKIKIGAPMDSDTEMGPLSNFKQLEVIEKNIKLTVEQGGKIKCGGKRHPFSNEGYYFPPTIIECENHNLPAAENLSEVSLELGGKSPVAVFDDAEQENAINGITAGIFGASGQSCIAGSRLYIQKGIYNEFLNKLSSRASKIKIGAPMDLDTEMGPLSSFKQLETIEKNIKDTINQGGKIKCGGKRDSFSNKGYYFPPTIIECDNHNLPTAENELFVPVLSVMKFDTEKEVIELMNDNQYGLSSGVYTSDLARGMRVSNAIRAGITFVNTYRLISPSAPFGGIKDSGYGKEAGIDSIKDYTRVKTTWFYTSDEPSLDPFSIR